jgi:hypothetical protein
VYIVYASDRVIANGKQVVVVRMVPSTVASLGGVSSSPYTAHYRRHGQSRATGARNTSNAFNTAAPNFNLTIGRSANTTGATFAAQKTYEWVLDNRAWSDREVQLYESYVGAKYGLPSLV